MKKNIENLYNYLTLEYVTFTLEYLEESVKEVNISNDWDPDNYIALQPYKDGIWMINFFGKKRNLFFEKTEINPKYYKRVII